MSAKPAIILVPGSFSPAYQYDPLIALLKSHGYEAQAVDLRSVGPTSVAGTTMADDAVHVASVIAPLVAAGKEVLLVSHSYGGVPATESAKGYTRKDLEAQGKKGGVIGIVYLTSVVPEVGQSCGAALVNAGGLKPWVTLNEAQTHMTVIDPHAAAIDTFHDIPLEEGIAYTSAWPGHSAISFGGELTYAAYNDVPVTYLLCEDDKIIPPEAQRGMVAKIKEGGAKVDVVEVKSGHCPNASQPELVIKVIRKAAGEAI